MDILYLCILLFEFQIFLKRKRIDTEGNMTVLIELKEKLKEFYGSCSGIVLPIVKFLLALAVFRGDRKSVV